MGQVEDTTLSSAHATAERGKKPRVFDVPLKNSLIEPKHFRQMGDSLWLYVWAVDHVTEEMLDAKTDERIGLVLGTVPHRDEDLARAIGCGIKTIRRWRKRLVDHGYFGSLRTPSGYRLWVRKSKKWPNTEPKRRIGEWTQTATHSKGDLPKRDSRFPATGSRLPQNGQCNKTSLETSPKTFPEDRASRASSSVFDLEAKILAAYKESDVKPAWRDSERRMLRELSQDNDPVEIISAFRLFLEDRDEWLLENRHPFGYFNKKRFPEYLNQARESVKAEFEAACLDEMHVIRARESVEVEVVTGRRIGHRVTCHPDQARQWFASGYAKPCEPSGLIPEIAQVEAYGSHHWIDRQRLPKFVAKGICVEVK